MSQICVFNPTSKLIDLVEGAVTGPGVAGVPVVLNQNGLIDPTLFQQGTTAKAGEGLNPGNLVNLYNDGGILSVQLAYAAGSGTAPSGQSYPALAVGFVNDPAAIGDTVTVAFTGIFTYSDLHSEFSSADIGAQVYLSPIDKGGVTKTRPAGPGQADQSVGYVLTYNMGVLTILFIAAYNDFTRISGAAQISQGGTGATTAAGAIHNIFGQPTAGTFFAGVATGPVADPTFRAIVNSDLSGAAGGVDTSIQFNSTGAVTGDASFTWDNTGKELSLNGSKIIPGTGDPEGVVTAPVSSIFLRQDGTAGNIFYLKETGVGNTGWTPGAGGGVIASADLVAQTTSMASPAVLYTPTLTGLYRISVYEECTAASPGIIPFGAGLFGAGIYDGAGSNDQLQTAINWTDEVGARSSFVPLPFMETVATNFASGEIVVRALAGQDITFQSALAASGTPTYSVFVRAEKL